MAEIDLLKTKSKTKNSKPISDQDFNNLLVEWSYINIIIIMDSQEEEE